MSTQIYNPKCPTCGIRMILFNAIPRVGSLPALRIYKCKQCGVRKTVTELARAGARVLPFPLGHHLSRQQRR